MPTDADVVPVPGNGGLPKVAIVAADGARAEIYLHGAHVTSWRPAGADGDRLFVSATTPFATGVPIRGGVPVCFPQFADTGPLPMHGLVRTATWRLLRAGRLADGRAQALLRIEDSEATRALWPHAFALDYEVTAGGDTLDVALQVANPGPVPFAFTGALHTYLRVADIRAVRVRGLEGAHYRDKVLAKDDVVERGAELAIDRFVDRVYHTAPDRIDVLAPDHTFAIRATGFPDTVVWNPDAKKGATIPDLEPDGYRRMLCVEAAAARAPVVVTPGNPWRGTQTLVAGGPR